MIFYKRLEYFFSTPGENDISNQVSCEGVADLFLLNINSSIGSCLSNHILTVVKRQIIESMQLVNEYLFQLKLNKRMPKNLYVGTTGQIWGRILARYIRRNGGQVTRFDHGSGNGYCGNAFASCIHEFEDCDFYVTFKETDKETQLVTFNNKYLVQSDSPTILAPFNDKYTYIAPPVRRSAKAIKKIMYVASIYENGWFHAAQYRYLRNIVFLDWQVRLMSKLKKMGFDVIFKPHPTESICSKAPETIQKVTGCTTINEKVESLYDKVDLVIFDTPLSSYFDSLVSSDVPAIYIDFGVTDFNETARAQLMNRFSFVKGYNVSNSNRADIDWVSLYAVIKSYHDNDEG